MSNDIAKEVGLVTRAVQHREHLGRPARVVLASRDFETDMADVWDALTNPERVPRWFLPITGELRLGGRYQLEGNAGGQIQTCEPPRHLALTWEFGGELSLVDVQLEPLAPARTRLHLEHAAPVGGDRWEQFGPGAVGLGWDLTLYGLGRHLHSKASKDPAAALAWMRSEEGKAFLRQSSEDWCRAAIAAGAAPALARAAAARTTAAYTGETTPEPSRR